MIKLSLNDNEQEVLDQALLATLNRLSDEISHTDLAEYRDMLKERKEILLKIQGKLH